MDGASSAFAVVSLAIQLVETGEKINSFLTSVQDAPREVINLGQTLDQLNTTLKQVSYLFEQQYLVLRLPGSPVFITNALENCENRIKTLEDVIHKAKRAMGHRNRVHRSWAAMKFVSKKEDIREMQVELRNAEAGLQTAMLSNSWQLQYVFDTVTHLGRTDHRTECVPLVARTLAHYKLQQSSNRHWRKLPALYHDMRVCINHLLLTEVYFALVLKKRIWSGIAASSEVSKCSSSQLH